MCKDNAIGGETKENGVIKLLQMKNAKRNKRKIAHQDITKKSLKNNIFCNKCKKSQTSDKIVS